MKLYHYAVFLRTSFGTVRRNIAVTERNARLASRQAKLAVERHVREPVKVMDCVPLRVREGKGERVMRPRSRRPVTVRKVRYVLARRPKARESAILTKKGVRSYEPRRPAVDDPHVPSSAKLRDALPKQPAPSCENKACQKRGNCGHRLAPGQERNCYEAHVKVGTGELVLRSFAPDAVTARKGMRAQLEAMGLGHKRLTKITTNPAPDPLRDYRGRLMSR